MRVLLLLAFVLLCYAGFGALGIFVHLGVQRAIGWIALALAAWVAAIVTA